MSRNQEGKGCTTSDYIEMEPKTSGTSAAHKERDLTQYGDLAPNYQATTRQIATVPVGQLW